MNAINTATVNTAATEVKTAKKTNWMIGAAGLLFWATVAFQFLTLVNDMVSMEFANHIIYNILPLTGALAYFGLKKELKALSDRNEKV